MHGCMEVWTTASSPGACIRVPAGPTPDVSFGFAKYLKLSTVLMMKWILVMITYPHDESTHPHPHPHYIFLSCTPKPYSTSCKYPKKRIHLGSCGQRRLGLSHRLVSPIGSWSPQNYDKPGVIISYPVENDPGTWTPENKRGHSGPRTLISYYRKTILPQGNGRRFHVRSWTL